MLDDGILEWHEHHKQICIKRKDYKQNKFKSVNSKLLAQEV